MVCQNMYKLTPLNQLVKTEHFKIEGMLNTCLKQVIGRLQISQLHEFLKSRRSVMARNMTMPGPTELQINDLIEIAARVPDHRRA